MSKILGIVPFAVTSPPTQLSRLTTPLKIAAAIALILAALSFWLHF
jgi:hypothetical protein